MRIEKTSDTTTGQHHQACTLAMLISKQMIAVEDARAMYRMDDIGRPTLDELLNHLE